MLEKTFKMGNFLLYLLKNPKKILTSIIVIIFFGQKEFKRRIKVNFSKSNYGGFIETQYITWFKKNYPKKRVLNLQRKSAKNFRIKPKFSILVPVYNTPEKILIECIESVLAQTYKNWQLCLADDASTKKEIREIIKDFAINDKRISYTFRKTNGGIAEASNSALQLAEGDFVGLLDHDDVLWPNALFEAVKLINQKSRVDLIYTDEEMLSNDSKVHFSPSFKPDWNFDYLRSANYIVHFTVIRRSLINKVGGFRYKFNGAQDWDLVLRITRLTKNIFHIPKVLYSWRISKNSTAFPERAMKVKGYAFRNQKGILEDDLYQRGLNGEVIPTNQLGIWRVKYEIIGSPLVSIIIPTKDKYEFIYKCLYSIIGKTTYKNFEIIIVDTGSNDKKVFNLYKDIQKKHFQTKVIKWEEEFNFSKVCNLGVEKSKGEYLIFLNNDTKVITTSWIDDMLEHAQREEVGAVGCKLLYPNKTIQHAGVILGLQNIKEEEVVAGHAFRGMMDNSPSTHLINSIRDYSAVTAACLMISRKKFKIVKGFDAIFRIAFNDIDFCLKLLKKGYFNVYTPFSVLIHCESISVGHLNSDKRNLDEYKKEIKLMFKKWRKIIFNDPQYNVNLTKKGEDFSIA